MINLLMDNLDLCSNLNLFNLINIPTWISPMTSMLLDVSITGCQPTCHSAVFNYNISDHSLTFSFKKRSQNDTGLIRIRLGFNLSKIMTQS